MIKKGVKLSLALVLIGIAVMTGNAMGDDDDGHYDGGGFYGRGYQGRGGDNDGRWFFGSRDGWKGSADVARAENQLYLKECGACHFAYQPGLLPARSWEKMMNGLEDHFGDNAELLPEDRQAIMNYLLVNSADKSDYKASIKIIRSLRGQAPLRISETPYFAHEHREIPRRAWADNAKVKSLSHCDRCHTNAREGDFNEHQVNIPGFGRWED